MLRVVTIVLLSLYPLKDQTTTKLQAAEVSYPEFSSLRKPCLADLATASAQPVSSTSERHSRSLCTHVNMVSNYRLSQHYTQARVACVLS